MIIDSDHGEVRYFRMARTAFGRGLYWTDVYLVDGLLVDSGPANMQREVARLVAELDVLVGHPHRPRGRLSDPETHRASALAASDRGRDSGAGTDALCLCRRRPADAIPIARVDRADATRGLPA